MSESDAAPGGYAAGIAHRLSPLGSVLNAAASLPSLIVPALAALWGTRESGLGMTPLLIIALVAAGLAIAKWYAFRFTIEGDAIRIEQGILRRSKRVIPFDRIVDIAIEQSVPARLLSLAEVRLDTGGGAGDEARLRYVGMDEAEQLRSSLRARVNAADPPALPLPGQDAPAAPPDRPAALFAMGPRRIVTMGFYSFNLFVFGLAIFAARRLDFLLPDAWFELSFWRSLGQAGGTRFSTLGLGAELALGLAALLALAMVGVASGIVVAGLTWWDFRLERTAKGLHLRYGLLTRHDVTVPPGRVLAAALHTGPIRARRGWQMLQLVSLGGEGGPQAHMTAAPFANRAEIGAIMAELNVAPPPERGAFGRASAGIAVDRWIAGAAVWTGLGVAGWTVNPPLGLLAIPVIALLALRAWLKWRGRGRAVSADHIFTRMGWWRRQVLAARMDAAQSVTLISGPLQRRRGLATLVFGLPGVTAGFEDIPREEALAIRQAVLARIAPVDYAQLAALLAQPARLAPAVPA